MLESSTGALKTREIKRDVENENSQNADRVQPRGNFWHSNVVFLPESEKEIGG